MLFIYVCYVQHKFMLGHYRSWLEKGAWASTREAEGALPQSSDVLVVGGIPEVLPQEGPKTSELRTPRNALMP